MEAMDISAWISVTIPNIELFKMPVSKRCKVFDHYDVSSDISGSFKMYKQNCTK